MEGTVRDLAQSDESVAIDQASDPSEIKKRSVVISGHRTSVSLENIFWDQLRIIADQRRQSVNQLVSRIDKDRSGNLSSAIRTFVLQFNLAQNQG